MALGPRCGRAPSPTLHAWCGGSASLRCGGLLGLGAAHPPTGTGRNLRGWKSHGKGTSAVAKSPEDLETARRGTIQ